MPGHDLVDVAPEIFSTPGRAREDLCRFMCRPCIRVFDFQTFVIRRLLDMLKEKTFLKVEFPIRCFGQLADKVPNLFDSVRVRVRASRCIWHALLSVLLQSYYIADSYGTRAERHLSQRSTSRELSTFRLFCQRLVYVFQQAGAQALLFSLLLRFHDMVDAYGEVPNLSCVRRNSTFHSWPLV